MNGQAERREELPDWLADVAARFRAWIPERSAQEALSEYRRVISQLVDEARTGYLAGAECACSAGCSACCHQMLAIEFVELCGIFFAQEPRFAGNAFRRKLADELAQLQRWNKLGAVLALDFAKLQWKEWWPCLFLGKDGLCTVYEPRPIMCRNLFSKVVCSATNYQGIGSEVIGQLAREMRRTIFYHLKLQRFSRPQLDLATYQFLLPQGMQWMLEEAPVEELREVFGG